MNINEQIEFIKSLHSSCGTDDGGKAKEKFYNVLESLNKLQLIIENWKKLGFK